MFKCPSRYLCTFFALIVMVVTPVRAQAPSFDPRPSLMNIISAFQVCGPAEAYQVLTPVLFQIVAQQTGGRGCYEGIANAGPIVDMRILDTKQFPIGPLYVVRVFHVSGPVDWFIGFNGSTGKIEYLSFQNVVQGITPSVSKGPDIANNLGLVKPESAPQPTPPGEPKKSKSCQKFPLMCPK